LKLSRYQWGKGGVSKEPGVKGTWCTNLSMAIPESFIMPRARWYPVNDVKLMEITQDVSRILVP